MFFNDIIFAQHVKILHWYLFFIKSYGAISDSRQEKTPNWSSILAHSQVTEPLLQLKFNSTTSVIDN